MSRDFYKFASSWNSHLTPSYLSETLSTELIDELRRLYRKHKINDVHCFTSFVISIQQINRFTQDKEAYRNRESLKIYRTYCDAIVKKVRDSLPYINEKNVSLSFPVYPPLTIKIMEELMKIEESPSTEINIYKDLINEYVFEYKRLKSSTSFTTVFNAKNDIEQQKAQFIYILRG